MAPDEFLRMKLPESWSSAAETLSPAVEEDHRGLVEVGDERSWRSPVGRRRRTAEEVAEGVDQIGMLVYATAAMKSPVTVETKVKVKVEFGEVHLVVGSAAERVEPRGMSAAKVVVAVKMTTRRMLT